MALNFKKYQRTETPSLGTIAQIVGEGGSYRLSSKANWLSEKRVTLVLIKADGTTDLVTCSENVSKGLRSKEIRLSQLQNFEIKEQLTRSGEISNTVSMPSEVTDLPTVEIGKTEAPAYQPVSTFSIDELVAF